LRADILRAIDRPSSVPDPHLSTEKDQIIQRRATAHIQRVCLTTLQQAKPLLRPLDDKQKAQRMTELLAIVTDALNLSRSLSQQYPYIGVFFLDDKDMKKQQFKINLPVYQAHRGMKLREDDEDDDGRDPRDLGILGRPLDFVIEPFIRRAGNEEGQNYQKFKILHKAIVWMVSDADLDQNLRTPTKNVPHLEECAHLQTSEAQVDVPNSPMTPPLNSTRVFHESPEKSRKEDCKKSKGHDKVVLKSAQNGRLGHPSVSTREQIRQDVINNHFGSSKLSQNPENSTVNSSQEGSRTQKIKTEESEQLSSTIMGQTANDKRGKDWIPSSDGPSKKRKRFDAETGNGTSERDRSCEESPLTQIVRRPFPPN